MKPKISVTMITKNSDEYLKQCLHSVRWADEIIVVDDYSTDKTKLIAQSYHAKLFLHKWQGFAKQKNYAISKASNNWILSLDCDEIIDEDLYKSIDSADYKKYNAFYLSRKNYIGKNWIRHCGAYPDWQLRLFRKDLMKFADLAVHEQVFPVGKSSHLQGDIIHYTNKDYKSYLAKVKKYSQLDAQVLYEKKRPYSVFYLVGKPIKEFFHKYIVQKGFLDGKVGFIVSLHTAYSNYLAIKCLKKLYEKNR